MPRLLEDLKPSFAAGVLDPELHGRVDLEKFNVGLARCDNWIVRAHGSVINRPGTECTTEARNSARALRLIRFAFNTTQQYALVLGHQSLRVVKDGDDVVEADVAITALDLASVNPVLRAPAHGYAAGDDVYVSGIAGCPGGPYRVKATTPDTLELWGYDGEDIPDGPGWAWASGARLNRIYTLATPWDAADLADLRFTQSADVMTLVHPSYAPRALTRTDHAAWTLTTPSYGASVATPAGPSATPTGTGAVPHSYRVTAIDANYAESVASATASCNNAATLSATVFNTLTWSAVAGASYYHVYKLRGGAFGFLGVATAASFVDDGSVVADMTDTPPLARTLFNAVGKYPAAVTYHQQRLVYARTDEKPQGIFASRVADYYNHNTSVPLQEDDALSFQIAAQQANEIRHLVSLDVLLAFTSGGEWVLRGATDDLLTPSSVNPRPQGTRGCNRIAPLIVGDTVLFIEPSGAVVRDFQYSLQTDKYGGGNLCVLAEFLFDGYQIVDWAYQQHPWSVIWAVRNDGVVVALTYLREHDIWAWHTHRTVNGTIESVCVVRENLVDIVYFVVRRTIDGRAKRFVERMAERTWSTVADAFFVDCGIVYDGEPRDELVGLEYLEGETLAVLADGNVHPPVTVTDGRVTLQRNYSKIVVGLPISADLETLPLDPRQSVGRQKLLPSATARVLDTRGLAFGPTFEDLYEPPQAVVAYDTALELYTGDLEVALDSGWNAHGRICVRQAHPLPATLLSLVPDVAVSTR
jgi:hypothetical protein